MPASSLYSALLFWNYGAKDVHADIYQEVESWSPREERLSRLLYSLLNNELLLVVIFQKVEMPYLWHTWMPRVEHEPSEL